MNMEQTINKNLLLYQVALAMTCRACGQVLDAPQAVSVDLIRDKRLLRTMCICVACYDKHGAEWTAASEKDGLTVAVLDGRVLLPRRKRGRR